MAVEERAGRPWSDREVRETVRNYLEMLQEELAGREVNKSANRTRLLERLPVRTKGAVEYKHQNISAVMQTLGLPAIRGYKPAWNVQSIIAEIVRQEIAAAEANLPDLPQLARARAAEMDVDVHIDTGAIGVEVDPAAHFARTPDAGHEARILGLAGELWVVRMERQRLRACDRSDLAEAVDHVSVTKGDGLGYDVASFEGDGRKRLIEVKTTAGRLGRQFIVTPNELDVSRREASYSL